MLLFLDIQTTGLEYSDKICSIGIVCYEKESVTSSFELINENKKIPPLASSIHHITNEMIQDKKSFLQSDSYKFLQKHNKKNTILIMHNAKFDLEMLQTHQLFWKGQVIDTLRVTKHLIPECDIFSLQFLRYELQLYKNEKIVAKKIGIDDAVIAYNKLSNTILISMLYDYLLEYASIEKMLHLSSKNVLIQKFRYGKYANQYIEDIAISDRGYLFWMLENIVDLDEDVKYSIEYFLGEY